MNALEEQAVLRTILQIAKALRRRCQFCRLWSLDSFEMSNHTWVCGRCIRTIYAGVQPRSR